MDFALAADGATIEGISTFFLSDKYPLPLHIGTKNVRYALLGSMNDPVFGLTQAGFYTQFRFTSAGQNFGSAPILDSVVLQLSLASIYGDTTTLQTVHVYQLTDSITSSDPYYS